MLPPCSVRKHLLTFYFTFIFRIPLSLALLKLGDGIVERTIRKLTIQRNNSLHYGSDDGVEMAATYHCVIETVELHGSFIWNFIGLFWKNIFNGCRDYFNMTLDKITLVTR